MSNTKKDNDDVRKNLVHISFSNKEIEDIDSHVKPIFATRTDFIREAIFEKINKMDHPELYAFSKSIDTSQIKPILEMLSNNTEKINDVLHKLDVITNIQDTLKALKSTIDQPKMKDNEVKVIEVLKQYTELTPKKIAEYTGLTKEQIYDVISNDKVFSINIKTGGIRLK